MNNGCPALYLALCKLPVEEQKIFLRWARDEVNKLDKELKQKIAKEKENVQTDRADIR